MTTKCSQLICELFLETYKLPLIYFAFLLFSSIFSLWLLSDVEAVDIIPEYRYNTGTVSPAKGDDIL